MSPFNSLWHVCIVARPATVVFHVVAGMAPRIGEACMQGYVTDAVVTGCHDHKYGSYQAACTLSQYVTGMFSDLLAEGCNPGLL